MTCKTCNNEATHAMSIEDESLVLMLCDFCKKDLDDFIDKELNHV